MTRRKKREKKSFKRSNIIRTVFTQLYKMSNLLLIKERKLLMEFFSHPEMKQAKKLILNDTVCINAMLLN